LRVQGTLHVDQQDDQLPDLQQQRARRGELHWQQQARRGNGARDVTVKPKLQGNRKFRSSTQRTFLRTIDLCFAHEGCFLLPRGNHTKDGSFLLRFSADTSLHHNHFHLVNSAIPSAPLDPFIRWKLNKSRFFNRCMY
jgi:hypothetical protein